MRLLLFCNNQAGLKILHWLGIQRANLVGVVLHPREKQTCGDALQSEAEKLQLPIIDGSQLQSSQTLFQIQNLGPDLGISIWFGYILKPSLLEIFTQGCINLHPSLLPWNRGAHPNVWSLIEGTPSGVTLHKIDTGIDTGPILKQVPVPVEPTDTAQTLYQKLETAAIELFQAVWPELPKLLQAPQQPQTLKEGSSHKIKDLQATEPIDLDEPTTARQLLNLLRARTFPPHLGTYFLHQGKKIYLQLQLTHEDDIQDNY